MDYKNKYIKYKNKYLNLKNNIGGINIDKIKRIPGGRRSGLPLKTLIKMVKNKTGIFFLDKADPKNFPKNSILGLKPGYHIHGIFKKGQIWNDNGKKGLIDESRPDLLYRTDFFGGLGWMLTRELWVNN